MGRSHRGQRPILAAAEADDEEGGGAALREAEDFLADVLSVGPILAKEVQRQAKEAAFPTARSNGRKRGWASQPGGP